MSPRIPLLSTWPPLTVLLPINTCSYPPWTPARLSKARIHMPVAHLIRVYPFFHSPQQQDFHFLSPSILDLYIYNAHHTLLPFPRSYRGGSGRQTLCRKTFSTCILKIVSLCPQVAQSCLTLLKHLGLLSAEPVHEIICKNTGVQVYHFPLSNTIPTTPIFFLNLLSTW